MDEREDKKYTMQEFVDKGYSIEYRAGEKNNSFLLHHKNLKKPINLIKFYDLMLGLGTVSEMVQDTLLDDLVTPMIADAIESAVECNDKDIIRDAMNITLSLIVETIDKYFVDNYDVKEREGAGAKREDVMPLIVEAVQNSGLMFEAKKEDSESHVWIPVDLEKLDSDLWRDTEAFLEYLQDNGYSLQSEKHRQAIRIYLYCYVEHMRIKGFVDPQEFFDIDLCDSIGLFRNSDDISDVRSLFKQINKGLKKLFAHNAEVGEMLTRNNYSEIVMMFALFMLRRK